MVSLTRCLMSIPVYEYGLVASRYCVWWFVRCKLVRICVVEVVIGYLRSCCIVACRAVCVCVL